MNGLRYSPNGELLASAHGPGQEGQILRIWKTSTGAVAADIADHHSGASPLLHASLAFSPDGRFMMRSVPGGEIKEGPTKVVIDSFIVHDTTTWQIAWALSTVPVFVSAFGTSNDGRYAVIAGQERLERNGVPYLQPKMLIVDLAAKRVSRSIDVFADWFDVPFVAWAPDSHQFALGGRPVMAGARLDSATVEVFDASSGQLLGEYEQAGASHVTALMYSPIGHYLVIGWDDRVEIWDAAHKKLLQTIAGKVNAAVFSPDGNYLAISTGSHAVSVWTMRQAPQQTANEYHFHK
jgi:WD40 repeat protein